MSGRVVLFTPVGGTDPISWNNMREGAILQICRKYRPDVVYMYMSAEILEKHKKDNRYLYCLERLEEVIGKKMEYIVIERPELHEVQKFNYFYEDFHEILQSITEKLNKDDELILNVSSGTPAMKSTLMVLSSLTRMSCKVVQVKTPSGKMNEHTHPEEDVELMWELDLDNNPEEFKDRTQEVSCPWIIADQKKRLIRSHILAYDYDAALRVHEQIPLNADGSYVQMIEAAAERKLLNDKAMFRKLKEIGEDKNTAFRPVRNDEMRMLFEYVLTLDIRQKRGEYGDLVRALTPPITDLFLKVLEKYGSINITEYYYYNEDKKKRWDLSKINGTQLETVMLRFLKWDEKKKTYVVKTSTTWSSIKNDYMQSTQLLNLIKVYVPSSKSDIIQLCEKVRYIEDTVRNRVAHEMVGVSDEFIKAKVSYSSEEIVEMIQKLLYYLDGGLKKHWNSYDKMNECILERMENELARN